LSTQNESSVQSVFHFIDKFNKLVNAHGSKVVFLEIPPYSIVKWNTSKGHRSPSDFIEQDKLLQYRLALVNEYIQQVNYRNSVASPNFRRAVLRCHSSKRGRRYTTNFGLYTDGVHPSPLLTKYWLRSVLTAVERYC